MTRTDEPKRRAVRRRGSRTFGLLLLTLLACLPWTAASAARSAVTPAAGPETFMPMLEETGVEPGWRLRLGFIGTDNIERVPEDGQEEIIGVGEFGANWQYLGPRLAAAFDGTIAYRHYTEDTFDDEARANFLAAGDWFIIPNTFDWFATARVANAPVDPLGSTSPANVQFVNVIETGPRLTLRPGSANELTLGASRADVNAEESPVDHSRDTATFGFARDITANSSFGIIANAREVDFEEDTGATDFEQQDAHLNFESRTDTMSLSFAGGRSRVELADGFKRDTGTGWLRVGMRRTSRSYVHLGLERSASDAASALLRNELLLEQGGVSEIIITGDPLFTDRATLRYERGWHAHEWFVAASANRTDYFLSPLDQEQKGLRLGADLSLSPRLLLSLVAAGNDIEYQDVARSDTLRTFLAETDYRIDRRWSLVTGLRWLERGSTDPVYAFDEIMLTLFLSYSPRGRPAREGL